jgi:hypothetical protein
VSREDRADVALKESLPALNDLSGIIREDRKAR